MCSVDILQKINSINTNIMHLYKDRLNVIGKDNALQLRVLPKFEDVSESNNDADSKHPISSGLPESTRHRLNDTFHLVLELLQINDSSAYSTGENFLNSLKEVVTDFPAYNKNPMDEDLCRLYDETKNKIEKNAPSLVGPLESCKDAMFGY